MSSQFCRITGHSRILPHPTHYFPILPPISPTDAKKSNSTNRCRITCNFNPNHNYVPITKSFEETSVKKCKITEKSIYEYKHFLSLFFGGINNEENYYYKLKNGKILLLPQKIEKELNAHHIKEIRFSEQENKIAFRYINTVKEYDLSVIDSDGVKVKIGKGIKKRRIQQRKKSAVLLDLKTIFEQKEKLAELAEIKAVEKTIQPDREKVEKVKCKLNYRGPVYGYLLEGKFVEANENSVVPEGVTRGQWHGNNVGFIAGEIVNDTFVPGKRIDNAFTPGIVNDSGQFIPGQYVDGQSGEKRFIPGKTINGVFTPGQMIKNKSKSEFIPGQVVTFEGGVKKFVPGLIIGSSSVGDTTEDAVIDFQFVPGKVSEEDLVFTPGELVETAEEELKFVCERVVGKDAFEVQTFEAGDCWGEEFLTDFDWRDVVGLVNQQQQQNSHSGSGSDRGDEGSSRRGSASVGGNNVIIGEQGEEEEGAGDYFIGGGGNKSAGGNFLSVPNYCDDDEEKTITGENKLQSFVEEKVFQPFSSSTEENVLKKIVQSGIQSAVGILTSTNHPLEIKEDAIMEAILHHFLQQSTEQTLNKETLLKTLLSSHNLDKTAASALVDAVLQQMNAFSVALRQEEQEQTVLRFLEHGHLFEEDDPISQQEMPHPLLTTRKRTKEPHPLTETTPPKKLSKITMEQQQQQNLSAKITHTLETSLTSAPHKLLLDSLHLAEKLGKHEIIKEIESLLKDEINLETVLSDAGVVTILRQLVVLRELMKKEGNKKGVVIGEVEVGEIEMMSDSLVEMAERVVGVVFRGECEFEVLDSNHGGGGVVSMDFGGVEGRRNVSKKSTQDGVTTVTQQSSFFSSTMSSSSTHEYEECSDAKHPRLLLEPYITEEEDDPFSPTATPKQHYKSVEKSKKITLKSAQELQQQVFQLKLSPEEERLAQVSKDATLRELIETEEEFVKDLEYVLETYYKENSVQGGKLRECFEVLEKVHAFHSGILLEGLRYYTHDAKMIGRTFLRLERYLTDLHAHYISETEPGAQGILQQDSETAEYFETLTATATSGGTLSSLLKLPCQRLHDYQLILQDLIDIQHILQEDTYDLDRALDLLYAIPQKISDGKFLNNIEGLSASATHNWGRILGHDWSTVTRQEGDHEESKQRYVFLFKNRILITKVKKISDDRVGFVLREVVKLPSYTLIEEDATTTLKGDERNYVFEFAPPNTSVQEGEEEESGLGYLLREHCCFHPLQQEDGHQQQRQFLEETLGQLKREGSLKRRGSSKQRRGSSAVRQQQGGGAVEKEVLVEEGGGDTDTEKGGADNEKRGVHVVEGGKSGEGEGEKVVEGKVVKAGEENKKVVPAVRQFSIQEEIVTAPDADEETRQTEATLTRERKADLDKAAADSSDSVGVIEEKKSVTREKPPTDPPQTTYSTPTVDTPTKEKAADKPPAPADKAQAADSTGSKKKSDPHRTPTDSNLSAPTVDTAPPPVKEKAADKPPLPPTATAPADKAAASADPKNKTDPQQKIPTTPTVVDAPTPPPTTKDKKSEPPPSADTVETDSVESPAVDSRTLRRRSSIIRKDSIKKTAETMGPPTFTTPLRSVECEPGDTATLTCTTSTPSVTVTWLHQNHPLLDTLADRVKITSHKTTHTLTLLNTRNEDSGLYTAKVTDENFGTATCSAVLTVHELTPEERKKKIEAAKCPPEFFVKFKDTELLKDTRVSFMFVVMPNEGVDVTFYHDGMILQPDPTDRTKITRHPDGSYEFCIDGITEGDAGDYKATATNKHGSTSATATVRVVDEKDLFKGIETRRLLSPGEEPEFSWFFQGRPFTPDEKLKVLFKEDEDTLALVFQHVTPDDAGLYTCVAQTTSGKISCSAELTVQGAIHQLLKEPCAPTIIADLGDTEVNVGGSAMMELKVTGFPKPTVTWTNPKGEEITAGGRYRFLYEDDESIALIIKNVEMGDKGPFTVTATNDLGKITTKGNLIVKAPPRFLKKMTDRSCNTEDKLTMECQVEGNPKPEVKWYKDGQLIIASERIKFTELEDGRFQITIERVTLEDTGAYSVVASNAIGQMSEFWNLVAKMPAKISRKPPQKQEFDLGTKANAVNFSVQGSEPITVTCTNEKGTKLKVENLSGGEYRCLLDCTERENFKIKVEAKNESGSDVCETQVFVKRSAKITAKLQNADAAIGQECILKVKVDAYPPVDPAKVNWFIDGVEVGGKEYEKTSEDGGTFALKIKNVKAPSDGNKLGIKVSVDNGLGDKDECSAELTVKAPPRIKKPLDALYRLVEESENKELSVEVDSCTFPGVKKVSWYHNGTEVSADARIKISKKSTETYSLTFNVVKYEDQGEWSVKVENEVGEVWSKTRVIVEGPPTIPTPLPQTLEVIESEKMELTVTIKDYCEENTKITWTLDSSIKLESNETRNDELTVSKIILIPTKACQKLTVTAVNKHGEATSVSKLIDLNLKPSFGKGLEPSYEFKEGLDDLVLSVEVNGPDVEVIWMKDGVPVDDTDPRVSVKTGGGKSTLKVKKCDPKDRGRYSVVLKNPYGSVEAGTDVGTRPPPSKPSVDPPLGTMRVVEGTSPLTLSTVIKGYPPPEIESFEKDGIPLEYTYDKNTGQFTYTKPTAEFSDAGTYKLKMKNENGGTVDDGRVMVVKERPAVPPTAPFFLKTIGNTEVYPGMTAKFTACVGGIDPFEYEWTKNGQKIYPSDRILIEQDGPGLGLLRLIIKDVDTSDLSDYTLRIWNPHGSSDCTAHLKFDTLSTETAKNQPLGNLYKGFEETKPTAIPNRPVITKMTESRGTLHWDPCLPHVSRIPCTYLVESCPADQPDNWTQLYEGLKSTSCDVTFPNPSQDYKYRIRVQWGPHTSEPSPYCMTNRRKFDTRPPEWKPQLVPSIPRAYDLSRPPHDGYTHAPRFLNREREYQYSEVGMGGRVCWAVYGYPKPTLTFLRDNVPWTPDAHTYLDNGLITLFIHKMDPTPHTYTCIATNPHGSAEQSIPLLPSVHPRFITRPQETYAMAGRTTAKITARLTGVPLPDIKIYKDWHLLPLTSETRIKLTTFEIDSETIEVIVQIEEPMMRDDGLYTILGVNVSGSVHSSAMIHIEETEPDYYYKSNLKGRDIKMKKLDINNYYDFGEELGRGTQSANYHVVERSTGKSWCGKSMTTRFDPRRVNWVLNEYNMWNGLNHRNICRLHDAYSYNDTYYLISDICTGGDIFGSLLSRKSFTERDVCGYTLQLLKSLSYLHSLHMCHLSITPLDILLTHINSNDIKLTDFSLARKHYNEILLYGHPEFVSPEIARGEKFVGPWCDMWAVGIITYMLLGGGNPFAGNDDRETLENVKNGQWVFSDSFSKISSSGRDFVRRLITYEYKERMDVEAALAHPWFHMLLQESGDHVNIYSQSHEEYYGHLRSWNAHASCLSPTRLYRRNPLSTAHTDPSRMVYPPNYNEDDDFKLIIPVRDELKLNGYERPEIDDFVSESRYQSGEETYLLQLRDTDFPARLRQYMKVAASHSPSFQFQIYRKYEERDIPVIRERRKFTSIQDEEIEDEKNNRYHQNNSDDTMLNPSTRRLRTEVGTRLDFIAEAEAYRTQHKKEGQEPIFRETPPPLIHVKPNQEELTLKVVAAGDPACTIQFFKNDTIVMTSVGHVEIEEGENQSVLKFKGVKDTDLTIYKISIRNKWGQKQVRVRVRYAETSSGSAEESLDYGRENDPLKISTDTNTVQGPHKLLVAGKFGSVIRSGSMVSKICTEQEFQLNRKMVHVNLFNVSGAWQSGGSILTSMDGYPDCCTLLQHASEMDSYTEQDLMEWMTQTLLGLQYLHYHHGLALLNLEPGNILVSNNKIKLADFSCAQPISKTGGRVDFLTQDAVEFTAPEVLLGESTCMPQTDTWNVGILLYIMLSGVSPFLGGSDEETKENVVNVSFKFEPLFENVSQEANRFILMVFKRSAMKRPTSDECLEHRWFQLSDHMIKKRETKGVFSSRRIKDYHTHYLERKRIKMTQDSSSNHHDFVERFGANVDF